MSAASDTEAAETTAAMLDAAAATGMQLAVWARLQPDARCVRDPNGAWHSFAEINARANQLARLFQVRGLEAGDAVALISSNRSEFVETVAATRRAGLRLTPINWHLTPQEIGYIIADCEAKAVLGDARVPGLAAAAVSAPRAQVRIAFGGAIEGWDDLRTALDGLDGSDLADPVLGNRMLYTSGTTGRPKGVYRARPIIVPQAVYVQRGYERTAVQLCAGPAYHSAPLVFDVIAAMDAGVPLVFLDKWDAETALKTISEERITHLHLVPIMFQRLLALPEAARTRWPVHHVRYLVHGAAPCPPDVKRAMIDWFGPVLYEYYAGSEGSAGIGIDSQEWLKKPGSVGKRPTLSALRILDDQGFDVAPGKEGTIYQNLPEGSDFSYFNDAAKTALSRVDGYFTMGDIGYLDDDDYLFLTGRSAETIISGGVNIYPQEIDNELIKHGAVADAATVGVPHAEWGEQVHAVIELAPGHTGSPELAQEILTFARKSLPGFKVPRALDFAANLPRNKAGKIERNKVRATYWDGLERKI